MGYKYEVEAAAPPFYGYTDSVICETLEEAVAAIRDFQQRGLWIIELHCRDQKV